MLYVNGDSIIDIDDDAKNGIDKGQKLSEDQLEIFWPNVQLEVKNIKQVDAKTQVLPLARIKKIMKLDENAKMIAAEAPLLFAKAAEIFIQELTLRAWIHTQGNKRRTLQKSDIATAISKCDQFDFLIDIVPREETTKPARKESDIPKPSSSSTDQVHYYFQLAQQQALQGTSQSTGMINQSLPVASNTSVSVAHTATTPQNIILTTGNTTTSSSPVVGNIQSTQPIQFLQQVVTSTGEITHVPITITPNQFNLLRMGLGNGANTSPAQQVIIPTIQTQQAPIVQVTSNQQPNTSNIYLGTNQHQQQSLHEDKNKNIANQFRRNC